MHPALIVLGYSEAAMLLRGRAKHDLAGLISIHGRREFGVEANVPVRLDLTFDDLEVSDPADELSGLRALGRKRWAEQNGLVEAPPTPSDAASIIGFADSLRGSDGIVLCHCGGGMSRAPAAALICLAVWRGPGAEVECVDSVRRLRRGAVPHVGLVRYADTLLGRGGRLINALLASRP